MLEATCIVCLVLLVIRSYINGEIKLKYQTNQILVIYTGESDIFSMTFLCDGVFGLGRGSFLTERSKIGDKDDITVRGYAIVF